MKRGDVWLVALEPTIGSEIRKTRPSLIISPDDLNDKLRTVVIAPMTTKSRAAPYRVAVELEGQAGLMLLDQVRTVAKERLRKKLGTVEPEVLDRTLTTLVTMFEP